MDASPWQRALRKDADKKGGPSLQRHRCAKVEMRIKPLEQEDPK
jgi:hypothetical protein